MARGLVERSSERQSAAIGFLSGLWAIASNTFVEGVRQPVYAVIVGCATGMIVVSPYLTMFTLQQSPKLVTDMGLATIMLAGVLLAAFSASSVISDEIENKTALTVVAKPVGRMTFILGKFLGVLAGLVIGVYLLSLTLVLTVAGGALEADIEQELSLGVVAGVFGAMALAVGYGVYGNFFQDRPFPSRAIGAAIPLYTIVFLIFCFLEPQDYKWGPFGTGISIETIYACVMMLWSILVLASVAVAASTRLTVVVNVAVCSGVFVVGLLSDFLFKSDFSRDMLWARVLYRVVPNLQVFWVADLVSSAVPINLYHVLVTGLYAFCLVMAFLCLAMALFQERQLA